MCMLHATPHRAYMVRVLHASIPELKTHHGNDLLEQFRQEATSGVYDNPEVWHPVTTELLTFAANHMEDIQDLVSQNNGHTYPVCDVLEGIADFIGCLEEDGFTPEGQSNWLRRMEAMKVPNMSWQYGELGILALWTAFYAAQLPLTTAQMARISVITRIRTVKRNRARALQLTQQVQQRNSTLLQRISTWSYRRLVRLENFDLTELNRLLLRGHTLTECRDILLKPNHRTIPARKWQDAYANWQAELSSLPISVHDSASLKRQSEHYQKRAKRGKTIARYMAMLVMRMESGLPLIRHVWPGLKINIDLDSSTCRQLQDWNKKADMFYKQLKSFVEFHDDDTAQSLFANVEAFLLETETTPVRDNNIHPLAA